MSVHPKPRPTIEAQRVARSRSSVAHHKCAEESPSVEREARHEVEQRKHDVERPEPQEDRRDGAGRAHDLLRIELDAAMPCRELEADVARDHTDDRARERADGRHEELGLRARRLVVHVRHSAEDEQGDAGHVHADRAPDDGMRELVDEDRHEEEHGRRERDDPA